jgi:hypothetical protein
MTEDMLRDRETALASLSSFDQVSFQIMNHLNEGVYLWLLCSFAARGSLAKRHWLSGLVHPHWSRMLEIDSWVRALLPAVPTYCLKRMSARYRVI